MHSVRRSAILAATSIATVLSSGCADHAPLADVTHRAGEITFGTDTWLWQNVSFTQVANLLGGEFRWEQETTQNTRWVQAQVDRLHQALIARYPERMKNVPGPLARVYVSEEPNAFSLGYPTCIPRVRVVFDGVSSQVPAEIIPAAIHFDGQSNGLTGIPPSCARGSAEDLKSFVAAMAHTRPSCPVRLEGSVLHMGKGCSLADAKGFDPRISNAELEAQGVAAPEDRPVGREATGIVFMRSSNFLAISTSLLKQSSPDTVLATMAHELAHYYRAHTSSFSGEDLYYFFRHPEMSADAAPTPEEGLNELGYTLLSRGVIRKPFAPIEGLRYRLELAPAISQVAPTALPRACTTDECVEACRPLAESGRRDGARLTGFPHKSRSERADAMYLRMDEEFAACAAKVPFSKQLSQALSGEILVRGESQLPLLRMILDKVEKPFATVAEWADLMSRAFATVDAVLADVETQAKAERLGFYSAEQEADELSVEILSLIGVDPRAAIENALNLQKITEEMAPEMSNFDLGLIPYEECKAMAANGWKDAAGNPVFVLFGSYGDPAFHHSSCYRAFNMEREIEAHGYATP